MSTSTTEKIESLVDQKLRDIPWVALDFETTGLYEEKGDRAIEIALVKRWPDGREEHWSSLLHPERQIPIGSQNIHGITNRMVYGAPKFREVYPLVKDFLSGSVLLAHNSDFDTRFLISECKKSDLEPIQLEAEIDTLSISRNCFGLPRNNLTAVSTRFQLLVSNAHRALPDAHNTLKSFENMLDDLEARFQQSFTTTSLNEMIHEHAKRGIAKKEILETLEEAFEKKQKIAIHYISRDPNKDLRTERIIKVVKLRLPYIDAYCYLRKAERVFYIKQIQMAEIIVDSKNTENAEKSGETE